MKHPIHCPICKSSNVRLHGYDQTDTEKAGTTFMAQLHYACEEQTCQHRFKIKGIYQLSHYSFN